MQTIGIKMNRVLLNCMEEKPPTHIIMSLGKYARNYDFYVGRKGAGEDFLFSGGEKIVKTVRIPKLFEKELLEQLQTKSQIKEGLYHLGT